MVQVIHQTHFFKFVLFNAKITGLTELLKTLVDLANTGIFPKVPGVWEGYVLVISWTKLNLSQVYTCRISNRAW